MRERTAPEVVLPTTVPVVRTGTPAAPAARRRARGPASGVQWRTLLTRYGVLIALLATVAVFGALRPDSFLTLANAKSILTLAAPLAITASGLTVVLVLGDFDLSIGSMIGLGGASAVVLMSMAGIAWPAAVALALGLGLAAGLVNGVLVAYAKASSFIVTLGMGTVLTGLEFSMTGQKTVYQGIPGGYLSLGQSELLGINVQIWIALVVAVSAYVLLEHTEMGRYMYAAGANPEAARLSGVRVQRLRVVAFVLAGLSAALAGVLLTAQAGSSFSNAGQPYLLPAFAAVFLGSTVMRGGRFNALGTLIGVLFLGVIQTGLTMLQLSTAVVYLVEGSVLVAAILLARLGANR